MCKNCFSKAHTFKDCIYKLKCRANSCGKRHHTLLHRQDQQQISISGGISHKKANLPKTTFLQVLPVKVSNGPQTVKVIALLNPTAFSPLGGPMCPHKKKKKVIALLGAGSTTTLMTSKLADQLQIKEVKKDLNISRAISEPVTVVSRLVSFSMSSKHHHNLLEIKNAWVVDTLNLP